MASTTPANTGCAAATATNQLGANIMHNLHHPNALTEGTKAYIVANTVTDMAGGFLPGNTMVRLLTDVPEGAHHAKVTVLTGEQAGRTRHILTRHLRVFVPATQIIERVTA